MSEAIELSYIWKHTIIKILNYDLKSEMGIKIKELIVFNKLEDFNSLLNYTDDDFTPTGNLCYSNDNGEILHITPVQEFYNLGWYIQHLIDESGYEYDDDDWTIPLCEDNLTFQTNGKFMKYVCFTIKRLLNS